MKTATNAAAGKVKPLGRRLRRLTLRPDEPNLVFAARKLAGVTQLEVVAATKIQQAQLSAIERGAYSQLPIETARKLAIYFGAPIEVLFPKQRRSVAA